MSRFCIFVFWVSFGLVACAPPSSADASADALAGGGGTQRVRSVLNELFPQLRPAYIGNAPFPGFQEVLIGGQIVYVSNDGNFLLEEARALDLRSRTVAVSQGLLQYRRDLLERAPKDERIVFAPPEPNHTIYVFTDIECGYCRRLHQEVPALNRMGIAVEYLAFPRMGVGTPDYHDLVSVWCADDRQEALTDAKSGKPIPSRNCVNPVSRMFELGQQLGVSGTPAIFSSEGDLLGGYMTPSQILAILNKSR